MENQKELTQEERIAIIREAHQATKAIPANAEVLDFVEGVKTEEAIIENGLFNVQQEDVEDERQFLNSDSAEQVDEEDEDFGVSSEMREATKKQ